MHNQIVLADNLDVLRDLPSDSVPLVYIDPPFNTGRQQSLRRMRVTADESGDRVGFQGRRYRTSYADSSSEYLDEFDDYLAFLRPRLI